MRKHGKISLLGGAAFLVLFLVWTILIQTVDVKPVGVRDTNIGFAALNGWFHGITGVHMTLYSITDWLGLVPMGVCLFFAALGLAQLLKRKRLLRVDADLLILGLYYVAVILMYLLFEMIPINYRPILIEGRMEASYPSSTTLLVLCVMPTLIEQSCRRITSARPRIILICIASIFSGLMVLGRLISGVHWLTDIMGSLLLSTGLFLLYRTAVLVALDSHGSKRGAEHGFQ